MEETPRRPAPGSFIPSNKEEEKALDIISYFLAQLYYIDSPSPGPFLSHSGEDMHMLRAKMLLENLSYSGSLKIASQTEEPAPKQKV